MSTIDSGVNPGGEAAQADQRQALFVVQTPDGPQPTGYATFIDTLSAAREEFGGPEGSLARLTRDMSVLRTGQNVRADLRARDSLLKDLSDEDLRSLQVRLRDQQGEAERQLVLLHVGEEADTQYRRPGEQKTPTHRRQVTEQTAEKIADMHVAATQLRDASQQNVGEMTTINIAVNGAVMDVNQHRDVSSNPAWGRALASHDVASEPGIQGVARRVALATEYYDALRGIVEDHMQGYAAGGTDMVQVHLEQKFIVPGYPADQMPVAGSALAAAYKDIGTSADL